MNDTALATTSSLDAFFRPRTVAVVGASNNPDKAGNRIMRTLLGGGFTGEIAPVNVRGGEVLGRPAFRTVTELPWAPDLAVVAVQPEATVRVIEELGARGARYAIVHASGFAEMGPSGAQLQASLLAAARAHSVRLLGPNCLNLMVASSRLNVTGIPDLPLGRLALVSQSGGLVFDLIEYGRSAGLGLSAFVSVGNQVDLAVHDFLDYLIDEPDTAAVALYIEGVRPDSGRTLLEALRRLTAAKPVVALLGGRSEVGTRSAAAHTASLLHDARVLRGLLRQAGVIEAERLDELFPMANALTKSPLPGVPTVALAGGGGGYATIASDALAARGITLPRLAPETEAALRRLVPDTASIKNPLDWVDAVALRSLGVFRNVARVLADDPAIGGVILFGRFGGYVVGTDVPGNTYSEVADALGEIQRRTGKPLFLHSVYARQPRGGLERLRGESVPLFDSLEVAVSAFQALVQYRRSRSRGAAPSPDCRDDLLEPYARLARHEQRAWLLEPEALAWLDAVGVPVPAHGFVTTSEAAVDFAAALGEPVALKLVSAAVLHKSEAGGVHLDLRTADAVRKAFGSLQRTAESIGADFRGVLVTRMAPPGVEVAVGVARSELVGHALVFASGGTTIEALDDAVARPVPIDAHDAADMIAETAVGRVLARPRGMAPPPLGPLQELMVRLAAVVAGSRLVEAIDLNPIRVSARCTAVLDARVLLATRTACGQ